jgi:hypothetical protein
MPPRSTLLVCLLLVCLFLLRLQDRIDVLLGIIDLNICACNPATHLVTCGYFPCAPIRPSLAIHLDVADFVSHLFLQTSPGVTGISETLEDTLTFRGYSIKSQVSIISLTLCTYADNVTK